MKNNQPISDINRNSSPALTPMLLWLTHLKPLGGTEREFDIGHLSPEPSIVGLMNKKEKKIKQHKNKNQMKTQTQILKWLAILFLMMVGTTGAMAQVDGLDNTGDMTVCLNSTEPYGVVDTPTSTYTWKIDGATTSLDWTITSTGHNTISVHWGKVGNYVLTVQETTVESCLGPVQSIKVIVNPLPVVDPVLITACSGETINAVLPAIDKNGLALVRYDVAASVAAGLTGPPTSGTGVTDVNAIAADKFTNITGGPLTVVYTVTPYAGSCVGASFTITVTINSAPVVDPVTAGNVCSDEPTGIILPSTAKNSLSLSKYDITANVATGLTGSATTGNGLTDINAIAADKFTNVTGSPLTVVYTVVPYAGTCVGASFTITVTINSAPVVDPVTTAVCSGETNNEVLPSADKNSLALSKYDITANVATGLTGTPTTGNGLTNVNAIGGDKFTNLTESPLAVVYTVTPYSGSCKGAQYTITVTINSAPIVEPIIAASVCSDDLTNVQLPSTDKNSLALTKYDIIASVDPALTGTAATGIGLTNINAIAADKFTNITGVPLTVVYTVTPYAGSCVGAPFTITVTINSAPVVDARTVTACSGTDINVVLSSTDKNLLALTSYDITAVVDPELTGTATTGNGLTNVNTIFSDKYINSTAASLTVVYHVTPYANSCKGAEFTITVTVYPAVVTSGIYHN